MAVDRNQKKSGKYCKQFDRTHNLSFPVSTANFPDQRVLFANPNSKLIDATNNAEMIGTLRKKDK